MAGEVCHEIIRGDHFMCYPEPYQHPGTAGAGWEPGLMNPGWPFLVGRGFQESWGSTSLGGHSLCLRSDHLDSTLSLVGLDLFWQQFGANINSQIPRCDFC